MVKIRLARRGRKKLAIFDLVVANVTAPRDGRFIEKIGTYNPNTIPAAIVLNDDKALTWLLNGAQPTDTVRAIFSYRGVMYKKHLQIGVIKGAITQEDADAKYEAWKTTKDSKITGRVDNLALAKTNAAKARFEAETKVNESRVAAQAAKLAAEIAAANPEPAVVVVVEETPVAELETAPVVAVSEEVAVESTPVVEETPVAEVETAPVVAATEEIAVESTPVVEDTPIAEVETAPIVAAAEEVAVEETPVAVVEETPAAEVEETVKAETPAAK